MGNGMAPVLQVPVLSSQARRSSSHQLKRCATVWNFQACPAILSKPGHIVSSPLIGLIQSRHHSIGGAVPGMGNNVGTQRNPYPFVLTRRQQPSNE